jgi:hypothetical protein
MADVVQDLSKGSFHQYGSIAKALKIVSQGLEGLTSSLSHLFSSE